MNFMKKSIPSISNIYETIISPVLENDQGIDAEYLTNISLKILEFSSIRREWPVIKNIFQNISNELSVKSEKLTQNICGIEFKNPIGLAAGFDKNGIAANIWRDFGFGFSELGTVTRFSQPGNKKPRLFRLAKEQAALNRLGFNNNGSISLENNLIRQKIKKAKERENICIGINFGKSKITPLDKATEDYLASLKRLIPYCDYATINVSSPNTEGLRKLQDPTLLKELLYEIKLLPECPPLFVKIAPDLNFKAIDEICQLINEMNIEGLIATNTSLDRLGLEDRIILQTGKKLENESGGLSGRPLQMKANNIIKHIYNNDKKIILIGVGGIDSPKAAWERICSGASLIQIYTGWIFNGPLLVPEIARGILKQIEFHQITNIKEAIGSGLQWKD